MKIMSHLTSLYFFISQHGLKVERAREKRERERKIGMQAATSISLRCLIISTIWKNVPP
jgi:hypothetical protein